MKIIKFTILTVCLSLLLYINNDLKASQSTSVFVCIHVNHITHTFTKYHVLNSYENVFDCPNPNVPKGINVVGKSQTHLRTMKPFVPSSVTATDPECIYTHARI